MSLVIKKKEVVDIPPMKGGTYPAVCVAVLDIGTQHNQKFSKMEPKVIVIMEFPTKTVNIDGQDKPRWVSKEFTLSLNDKANLKAFIEVWLGRSLTDKEKDEGFDLKCLLGEPGIATVTADLCKDGKTRNRLGSVVPLMEGMNAPVLQSEMLWWDMGAEWDKDMFEKIPNWIQNRIRKSQEYQQNIAPNETIEAKDDESGCPI